MSKYVILVDQTIVNADMVWKSEELQSFYNELRFYIELASLCTSQRKYEQKDRTKTLAESPDHIQIDFVQTHPGG